MQAKALMAGLAEKEAPGKGKESFDNMASVLPMKWLNGI
jgi:hypothetical protein